MTKFAAQEQQPEYVERCVDKLSNGSVAERREAAEALSELAKQRKECRDYIRDMEGVVTLIVDRLSTRDVLTRGYLMTLLFHLAGDDDDAVVGADSESIATLVHKLLKRGPGPTAYRTAAKLLIDLSNLDGLRDTFGATGAIEGLIDVLRYRTGKKFQKDAIISLTFLLTDTVNRSKAIRGGIAPILLRLLVHGNPKDLDMDGILDLLALLASEKEGRDELFKIECSTSLTKLVDSGKLTKSEKLTKILLALNRNQTRVGDNRKHVNGTANGGGKFNSEDISDILGPSPNDYGLGAAKRAEDVRTHKYSARTHGGVPAGGEEQMNGSRRGSPIIPNEFRCPISLELMKDPVIVATGQTYDRESIVKWLEGGKRTCPKTRRNLMHTNLKPNHALSALIEDWCKKNGMDMPSKSVRARGLSFDKNHKSESETWSPESETIRTKQAEEEVESYAAPGAREKLPSLLEILSSEASEMEHKAAAVELHQLAKNSKVLRDEIVNAGAVPLLANLLSSAHGASIQELAISIIFILSLNEDNKRLIGNPINGAVPAIVKLLRNGTQEARETATTTLFSLSIADENKVSIGATDAIPALVEVLGGIRNPTVKAQKNAATGLLTLAIYQGNKARAVRAGVIPHLIKLLHEEPLRQDESMEDLVLAMLAVLSSHSEGRAAIQRVNALHVFVEVMRSGSNRNKENALTIISALIMKNPALISEAEKLGADEIVSDLCVNGTEKIKNKALALLDFVEKQELSD